MPDDPYPIADIDLLPDLVWDGTLMPSRVHLELAVRQVLSLASNFGQLLFGPDIVLSTDPMEAVWQLAAVLPVGELDRFDMLSAESAESIGRMVDLARTAVERNRPADADKAAKFAGTVIDQLLD